MNDGFFMPDEDDWSEWEDAMHEMFKEMDERSTDIYGFYSTSPYEDGNL